MCGTTGGNLTGKLWDGTTVLSSSETQQTASTTRTMTLAAVVSPGSSTTYKMSVAGTTGATNAWTLEATPVDNNTGTTNTGTWFLAVRIA